MRRFRRKRPTLDDLRADGWDITGPFAKGKDQYLSKDGTNPEAPWPGYGWPLGSECWYYVLEDRRYSLIATGLTRESALARTIEIATADDPLRKCGAVA